MPGPHREVFSFGRSGVVERLRRFFLCLGNGKNTDEVISNVDLLGAVAAGLVRGVYKVRPAGRYCIGAVLPSRSCLYGLFAAVPLGGLHSSSASATAVKTGFPRPCQPPYAGGFQLSERFPVLLFPHCLPRTLDLLQAQHMIRVGLHDLIVGQPVLDVLIQYG